MTDHRRFGQTSSVDDDAVDLATLSGGLHRHTYHREVSYTSVAPSEEFAYAGAGPYTSTDALRDTPASIGPPPDVTFVHERPHFLPHLFLNWRFELVACVVFVATFAALFGTLFSYSSKPSPDWPTWLSLNTVVAIYVALLKAGLLLVAAEGLGQLKWLWIAGTKPRPLADLVSYDDASRGPFGALNLLWRLKASHALSSLGALIVILALAVDPFAQQIIHYYDCSIPTRNSTLPSIPRTNFYAETGGFHVGAGLEQIVPAVQGAVNAGLYNPTASPSVNCETGNCTWTQEYSSLGWCSGCKDITDQLTFENHTIKQEGNYTYWNLTTILPGTGLMVNTTQQAEFSEWAAMGVPMVPGSYETPDTGAPAAATVLDFVLGQKPGGAWNPSTGGPFSYCNTTTANQTLWPCMGYGASQCWLSPCVKTFNASVEAGRLNETLLDTTTTWGSNFSNYQIAILDTQCIDDDERQSLISLGYEINGRWLPYNLTFYMQLDSPLNNTFPESMALKKCIYGMDVIFGNSFGYYLSNYFTGVLSGYVPLPESPIGTFFGPQPIQTIFNFGDIDFARMTQTFENISVSLTNYMRQNGDANNSAPIFGIANQSKTCIRVRWAWLAFPGTLVVLTLIFFFALVAQTRPAGDRPQIWKSSLLPLLYYGPTGAGLPEPRYDDGDRKIDLGGMQRRADGTRVRLDPSIPDKIKLEVQ